MTIRFTTKTGATFLLPDPLAIDTHLSGPCLRALEYDLVHRDGAVEHVPYCGDFRLRDAARIEQVEEQLEMQAA